MSVLVNTVLSVNSVCLAANEAQSALATSPGQHILRHSPLVTGNGFGYAVVATTGEVTKFYAHPYRFERSNQDITKDGPSTANFVKSLTWKADPNEKNDPYTFWPVSSGNLWQFVKYVSDSHVISVNSPPSHEIVYFMPFGLRRNALIAIRRPCTSSNNEVNEQKRTSESRKLDSTPSLCPIWEHAIKQSQVKEVSGVPVRVLSFWDTNESLALVPLSDTAIAASKSALPAKESGYAAALPGDAWALVALDKPEEAEQAAQDVWKWRDHHSNNELIDRELKEFEAWRKTPTVHFASEAEHRLWRQSETILRMAQIEEANRKGRFNHGLILASLPDGVWFTPWVRDMSYALVALSRMGHVNEAREGILSWFNARPVGRWRQDTRGLDYQISVTRYYGDGSEESDYSGQKTENCELDDWGLALWAISEYWQATHDQSLLSEKTYRACTVYESMRDFVVKPLIANLDSYGDGLIVAEDSSCWEEHQENKHHYACSTIAAIAGLRGFLKITEDMHDSDTVKLVGDKLPLLEKGFKNAFVKDGFVKGVAETDVQPKSESDGAVLETFNWNIITDPAIIEKTLTNLERLKRASGGYRRNLGPSNYEAHEFLLIDFNLARVNFKIGKKERAASMLETLVHKSVQDHGLIPEMYVSEKEKDCPGEIGDPAGAIPMVGFGAGDYIITITDRDKYEHSEPNSENESSLNR